MPSVEIEGLGKWQTCYFLPPVDDDTCTHIWFNTLSYSLCELLWSKGPGESQRQDLIELMTGNFYVTEQKRLCGLNFLMRLVILAPKKGGKKNLSFKSDSVWPLRSFCVGGLSPFKEFSLIIKGLRASCVWSLKLCPTWEIISPLCN